MTGTANRAFGEVGVLLRGEAAPIGAWTERWDGRRLAVGMEHVIVNGELVLHNGERTRATPGRALRP